MLSLTLVVGEWQIICHNGDNVEYEAKADLYGTTGYLPASAERAADYRTGTRSKKSAPDSPHCKIEATAPANGAFLLVRF